MKTTKNSLLGNLAHLALLLGAFALAGCTTTQQQRVGGGADTATTPTSTTIVQQTTTTTVDTNQFPPPPVRIKAGPSEPFVDADGHPWLTERGFVGGNWMDWGEREIANTKTPRIYWSEIYSMESFSYPVPNGKYIVKLHFCENYDGIMGPGDRVFSFNVEGKEFKDFDVWVKAGGPQRAYVETVEVEVTDGKLDITFTPQVENPEINGIEILPVQ